MCVDVKLDAWGIVGGACFGLWLRKPKSCVFFFIAKRKMVVLNILLVCADFWVPKT